MFASVAICLLLGILPFGADPVLIQKIMFSLSRFSCLCVVFCALVLVRVCARVLVRLCWMEVVHACVFLLLRVRVHGNVTR